MYNLADMVGRSVARAFTSKNTFPPISEFFPALFDSETEQEKLQEKKDELSALRFRQFAQSFNKSLQKGGE